MEGRSPRHPLKYALDLIIIGLPCEGSKETFGRFSQLFTIFQGQKCRGKYGNRKMCTSHVYR